MNGNENDEFMPDKAISREEFVKLVVCVFELKRTNEFKGYSDVPGDKWFSEYVAAAVENEIINGVGENRFGTGETLSRSDMAVIVHRLLKKLGLRLTEGGIYIEFDDETLIAGYALEAVKALAAGGIINGSGNNCFEPTKSCTRAEAVKMLYELYMTK